MAQTITEPALRIKITGACNRTCNFCNEEGDMRTIESVEPNETFFDCVDSLLKTLEFRKVMLTGGEPTIHPDFDKIVRGINVANISVTTNGIQLLSVGEWTKLRDSGLRKVIVSIHDATPQSFLQLETRRREFGWAVRALESQKRNLVTASKAGLKVRVNTVAYSSREQIHQVLDSLGDLQRQYNFDIRLLNDLANIEKSQQIIRDVCQALSAKPFKEERRSGSSNTTVFWEAEGGFRFSTKMSYQYFFDQVCDGCTVKEQCYEGFYGIRIERRMSDYWVRLCIYKHTQDILMPWKAFLQSETAKKFKALCMQERVQ